jgi:[acyl-carrier-protein] S-malonyltransferase
MTGRLAILCPGQGGQHPGMFALFANAGAALERQIETALGRTVASALSDNAALFSNRLAQPLVVAATLAAWETLRADLPSPSLVAGYSIGELSAHCVAGTFSGEQTIALAALRAGAMDQCATGAAQAMLAVTGMNVATAQPILTANGAYLAIETGFDTLIAGGTREALLTAEHAFLAHSARTGWLPVTVASHTPLMSAARQQFEQHLSRAPFVDPLLPTLYPVLAGVSGDLVRSKDQARTALLRQMTEPLRWAQCMDAMAENGITVALELGPGAALSRMLPLRQPGIACRSVADFRSIDGISQWVRRALDA